MDNLEKILDKISEPTTKSKPTPKLNDFSTKSVVRLIIFSLL